ncbi:uncharacterized protein LOC130614409 [Hydractinia symbiolongicarpus]|uniref:uncharacterized protein LOC130614409 n=1 Tax=Hydractinia symbiolongicarpus TaxID=13093 RepID=UPI00254D94BF|nr:uncharacterized protein LOC130614409 [Hydractinia symbiolongicarpus]
MTKTQPTKNTFYSFCFVSALVGAEYALIIPSLWYYLKKVIQTQHPDVFYSLTIVSFYVMAITGCITLPKYVNQTKGHRKLLLTLCGCGVVGNGLYAIPISVGFPLLGRTLQGFCQASLPIMAGQVTRIYSTQGTIEKITILKLCNFIPLVSIPAIHTMLDHVDLHVLGMKINNAIITCFVLCVLWMLCLLVSFLNLDDILVEYSCFEENDHDSSYTETVSEQKKQTDMENGFAENNSIICLDENFVTSQRYNAKETAQWSTNDKPNASGNTKAEFITDNRQKALHTIMQLFYNFELNVIIFTIILARLQSLYSSDIAFSKDRNYNLLEPKGMSLMLGSTGVCFILVSSFVKKYAVVNDSEIYIQIAVISLLASAQAFLISLLSHGTFSCPVVAALAIMLCLAWYVELVSLSIFFADIFHPSKESHAKSNGHSISLMLCLVIGFVPSFIYQFQLMYITFATLVLLSLILVVVRRKQICSYMRL